MRLRFLPKVMHSDKQKGNIIMEFLIYITICAIIFQGILNFILISFQRNEMAKISNFISFSISQDPSKLSIFTYVNQKDWMKFFSPNLDLIYSIYCGRELCSSSSDFVKITLQCDYDYLFFKIPISTSSQYQLGNYLSKN